MFIGTAMGIFDALRGRGGGGGSNKIPGAMAANAARTEENQLAMMAAETRISDSAQMSKLHSGVKQNELNTVNGVVDASINSTKKVSQDFGNGYRA